MRLNRHRLSSDPCIGLPPGAGRAARTVSLLCCAAMGCSPADALVFYFDLPAGTRAITLSIGSPDAVVNSVVFDVQGANIMPNPVPVTGVAGNGAPPTAPAGGILFTILTQRRGGGRDTLRLTANSAGGLNCQNGACLGSGATIPFTDISWTSYEVTGVGFAGGIGDGAFNGSGAQSIFSDRIPAGANSMVLANVLLFRYANATLYPSGVYSGRVTYTLSVP